MSKIFKTSLSSSNFALNSADGNPEWLVKLFSGMNLGTAKNILERGQERLGRPTRDSIEVPDDLIVED